MKKILLGLFLLICCFSLVACETGGNPGGEPEGPGQGNVNEESNYLKEIKDYLNEYIPSAVTENIDLIDEYEYEDGSIALLEWSSSNGRTISSKGVFRANLFDEKITLTANIEVLTLEGDSEIATFSKEVETEGSEDVEAYKAIIEAYLPDYTYHDIELVTRDTTYANNTKHIFISISCISCN